MKRSGIVTFKGNPVTLAGSEVTAGMKAPDFRVVDGTLSPVTLATFAGKKKIFVAVPSLDTPVCDTEARRFNAEAACLADDVAVMTVSLDLPFAQKRWCGGAGVDRLVVVSDYQDRSFAQGYGILIDELKLLARSVFVVDADDVVRYVQIVPEVTAEPDYDAVLAAVRGL